MCLCGAWRRANRAALLLLDHGEESGGVLDHLIAGDRITRRRERLFLFVFATLPRRRRRAR